MGNFLDSSGLTRVWNKISSAYLSKGGGTMTGMITTKTGVSHNGIKLGDTYLTSINGEVIFQNNTSIRFGGDSWDYDKWAALGYNPSNKIIYLGLAGTPYSANNQQSGGKIYTQGISDIYIGNGTYKVLHANNYTDYVKNASLTLQVAGTTQTTFYANDSTNRTFNVTCSNIGAQAAGNYVGFAKVAMSTVNSTNNFPYVYNIENETLISGYYAYWYVLNLGRYSGNNYTTQLAMPYQDSLSDTELFIRSANGGNWRAWRRVLHDNNYTTYTVTKTGGGASGTWGISISGSAATASSATSAGWATYAVSYLANRQTIGASNQSHAQALQSYFDNYKSSIPRDCLTANYSNSYGNGSLYFGYFLGGYDSTPYGGFYVCHYNTPYYVGISYGSYSQQQIITSSSIGSQSVNYASSAGNADTVDGYHYNNLPYLPISGGTMTGCITTKTGAGGIKCGDAYISSISNSIVLQGGKLRFGEIDWDWDKWAGLTYKSSDKTIYLGLADGTIFEKNISVQTGGTFQTVNIDNVKFPEYNSNIIVGKTGRVVAGSSEAIALRLGLGTVGHTGSNYWSFWVDDTTSYSYLKIGYTYKASNYFALRNDGYCILTNGLQSGGNIYASGTITAGSASDIRLKENISELNIHKVLNILRQLKPKKFNWNSLALELDPMKDKETTHLGYIAQEVEKLIPSAVTDDYFEVYKRLNPLEIIPLLHAAIIYILEKLQP